ncbi:MAG: substrate-binding domain-containing protein, partial [Thiotrichales bacterium]
MKTIMAALMGVAATTLVAPSFAAVDPALPGYQKVSGVSGNLSSVGSDTLANLATLWAEEFKRAYPNVNIQIQAAGSSTAPPALTEGTANIGPMSREMKSKEIEAFEAKYGYKPTGIAVAIDALAVYVHKDNPIKGLTMSQVDAIFSSTRKCGAAAD